MTQVFTAASEFCKSSIGRKILVAVTGLFFLLFLVGHLIGNLLLFSGPEAINEYAYFLKTAAHGGLLWGARIALLAALVIHVWFTIQLTRENRAARQSRYVHEDTQVASKASRSMIVSGLIVLAFVIFHILHFTAQVTHPEYRELKAEIESASYPVHDVYSMVIAGFSNWFVAGFYILSMALLCSHVVHGFSSVFQTLGLRSEKTATVLSRAGLAYAAIIFLGNITIPISVLVGYGSSFGHPAQKYSDAPAEVSVITNLTDLSQP